MTKQRVIVLGGLGLFGRTAVELLHGLNIPVQTASRGRGTDLQVDANNPASIHSAFGPGDVVLDAAGPFHARSTALIEAAIETGFDLIDINDDLGYAERVVALEPRIESAGIRVLSSASSVSALAATVVQQSGMAAPIRVTAFLVPATRYTAHAGTALSLLRSVGQPIRVFRDGCMQTSRGWSESRRFMMPAPLGLLRGRLFESADSVYLPRVWPTLRDVAMYVDANTPGVNLLLSAIAQIPSAGKVLSPMVGIGTAAVRMIGSSAGGIGYEIEDADGRMERWAITSEENSFNVAVAPAVLAAREIVEGRFPHRGLVPPDRHVEPAELFAFLQSRGIRCAKLP